MNVATRRNPVLTVLIVLAMVVALLPALVATASQAGAVGPTVFINELHYDNAGADAGEFVEVAGPAGTDLNGWTIALYNGSATQLNVYATINLAGTIPNQSGGFGTLAFAQAGIQNGAPDGLALVDAGSTVIEFLSYEGSFTAGSGPASGTASTDIGVSESSGTPIGESLQLTGTGTMGGDFTWAPPGSETPGAINTGQTFVTAAAIIPGDLVVNEVDYDQPSTDSAEFVEIKNITGASIDLSLVDLVFVNGSTNAAYDTIPLSGTLAAGDYFVVCGDAANVVNCDLDDSPNTNFIQNGAPDAVAIDFDGTIIDTVSYEGDTASPYTEGSGAGLEDNPADVAAGISRCADGADTNQNNVDFFGTRPITPGAANDCPIDETLNAGDLVINEIIQNPAAVSDSNGEWFEVFNNTADPIDLEGLVIRDDGSNAHTIGSSVIVASGGFAVLGRDANPATNGGVTVDYEYSNFFLGNSDDEVVILDGTTEIDRVNYDNGATFPDPNGASMSLNDTANDNNDGANWCTATTPFGDGDAGTPGAANDCPVIPPIGFCGDPATFIHDIQGAGLASPLDGQFHIIEGVVVGDFQGSTGLNGFFVQEEDTDADGDQMTSEGIFVFDGGFGVDVAPGDVVRVGGTVDEFFDLTEITNVTGVEACADHPGTASAATVTLPVASIDDFETTEGMAVSLPQELFVSGNFTQARFGEVDLSVGGPLDNPTNVATPGAAANALAELNSRSRIQLDDGSTVQNPLPLPPYLGVNNTLRTGDSVTGISAVMSYSFGAYELQPTATPAFVSNNARPAAPDVGGSITVAAYNVLNYFTTIDDSGSICGADGTLGCRGADTSDELDRQRAKIVAALAELDADVVGLIEIENPRSSATTDDALDDLINGPKGLNSVVGAGTYDYVDTGTIGTDAIKVALIYKPANVSPVGAYAILDSSVDPAFIDTLNRPVLAQAFQENGTDDLVTVAVNHLKSKGSPCDFIGDPDTGDGQGNCNLTRTAAADALVTWLATDPTGSGSTDTLIMGDLNAYAMEDPITTIESGGYTDLVELLVGSGWADGAYSFNFFSESGYLDHALASPSALDRVTGAGFWHVNADEPSGLDYNNFNQPSLYNADPYRSSDHDPVIVGLCETTAPVVDVTASPDSLWPPNHKYKDVETTVTVTDADPNATITLLSVTSNEPDNGKGDGNTINDIVIVDDFNFKLRAERSGNGDGRVYTITYQVTDECGNTTLASATVTVPLSKSS